jgi:heme A synthase
MTDIATKLLVSFLIALGAVTLFLGINAASVPFAIHMAIATLWVLGFLFWILRRLRNPP